MLKIAVLISGGGSNLQAIIDSIKIGELQCKIEYVISDKPGVFGLERASKEGITTYVFDKKIYKEKLSGAILEIVNDKVDLLVMAGYLSILQGEILQVFKNRIINIHPSLIPSFCGNGMYGIKVHQKAIETGVKISGCTVHFVDEGTDTGPIIIQRTVPVYFEDDAASLQKRILVEEHIALPAALKLIAENRVTVVNNRVNII